MKLARLAALLLATSPLVVGCSSDPTCDDVDDPDFNDLVEKLNRAAADCNA
jgi:hypothetical protein